MKDEFAPLAMLSPVSHAYIEWGYLHVASCY